MQGKTNMHYNAFEGKFKENKLTVSNRTTWYFGVFRFDPGNFIELASYTDIFNPDVCDGKPCGQRLQSPQENK